MSNKDEQSFLMPLEPEYEDKITCLDEDDLFSLFESLHAEPRWGECGGKRCISLLTLCHGGTHHNAAFDPDTLKITCFSECGDTVMLHTWVKRVLGTENPNEAKEFIMRWMDDNSIDFSDLSLCAGKDREYQVPLFDPNQQIEMVSGIDPTILSELYSNFDTSPETLARLVWCKPKAQGGDEIPVQQLIDFQVAYYPAHRTIILPHHNMDGEIVGLYERSFGLLWNELKKFYGVNEGDYVEKSIWQQIKAAPRAKYMPLLKDEKYKTDDKTCWSFPNSCNLYGLHRAKESIAQTGKAIIFEGAKSVMLARAYGYPYAVASHTFGACESHIAMLIQAGVKEIILAFDKQYQNFDENEWGKYEMKTRGLAERVGGHVTVSRVIDTGEALGYKDAPVDKGKAVFDTLFANREVLTKGGEND